MSHAFRMPLNKPKEQILQEAATLLPQKGFTFTPDESGGRVSGHGLDGTLRFVGQEMEVEIAEKPAFLPWSLVESKIREFFED